MDCAGQWATRDRHRLRVLEPRSDRRPDAEARSWVRRITPSWTECFVTICARGSPRHGPCRFATPAEVPAAGVDLVGRDFREARHVPSHSTWPLESVASAPRCAGLPGRDLEFPGAEEN